MAKIAIVGSGLIGRSWSIVFARAGHEVALWDGKRGTAETALGWARDAIAELAEAGNVAEPDDVFGRMSARATMEDALDGAVYVQESIVEDREAKRAIFEAMDAVAARGTILASSCSAIQPSTFMESVAGRGRCVIAHPTNPPHLVPLTEIVPSRWTTPETIARTRELLDSVGQVPVLLRKEVDGFALNRLQAAVVNEAVSLVGEGAITPADLDKCMKHGLGLRWAFMGPFETMDLNADGGFLDYAAKYSASYHAMGSQLKVAAPWKEQAITAIAAWRNEDAGTRSVADRQRWRDRLLVRLSTFLKSSGTR